MTSMHLNGYPMENMLNVFKIDYIRQGSYSYEAFDMIKNTYDLSLSRVNQVHGELKKKLRSATKGVSTKYLADYVGAYVYVHNWKVEHGRYPSSEADTELILLELLKNKTTYTAKDMANASLEMPQANDRYMRDLKKRPRLAVR